MATKALLVPLSGKPSDRVALDLAHAVALPAGAHVTALFVKPDPREALAYLGMGIGAETLAIGPIMEQLEREGEVARDAAERCFDTWATHHKLRRADAPDAQSGVSVAWREETGLADEVLRGFAGRVDLVVQPGLQGEAAPTEDLLEASLFGAARPLLVAPPSLAHDNLFRHAVVAWNGSQEANRALAAALGLLPRFDKVSLFCQAERHRPEADPAAPAELLSWHGIAAEVMALPPSDDPVGAQLLRALGGAGATCLVMGAYTHGRLRQLVFGGVTDHVLHHAPVPALLVH